MGPLSFSDSSIWRVRPARVPTARLSRRSSHLVSAWSRGAAWFAATHSLSRKGGTLRERQTSCWFSAVLIWLGSFHRR